MVLWVRRVTSSRNVAGWIIAWEFLEERSPNSSTSIRGVHSAVNEKLVSNLGRVNWGRAYRSKNKPRYLGLRSNPPQDQGLMRWRWALRLRVA